MATFIETPLCEQVLKIWKENCLKDGPVSPESVTHITDIHFRMQYVNVDLGREFYEVPTADGVKMFYHQMKLESDRPGMHKYSECVTFRKGEIENLASWDFYVRDHFTTRHDQQNLVVFEGGKEVAYVSSPVVVSKRSVESGKVRDAEFLATDRYSERQTESSKTVKSTIAERLDQVRRSWEGLAYAAENFSSGFSRRFDEVDASECDDLYILHTLEGVDYLTNLGGRRFIEAVNAAENTQAGLKGAYMQFQPRLMYHNRIGSVDEVLAKIAGKGKIALFTTQEFALDILGKADIDYSSLKRNRIMLGDTEIRMSLKRKGIDGFMDDFIDCLFIDDEYAILERWHGLNVDSIKEMIQRAEKSGAVRSKQQITGAVKRRQLTGLPLDRILGDEESVFFEEITQEIDILAIELKMLSEFKWWESIRERIGHVLTAPLNNLHFKSRERQQDFRRKFSEAYIEGWGSLQGLDYSRFIHLDPERPDSKNGIKYGKRRSGVGNIMIDFGDRTMLERISETVRSIEEGMETIEEPVRKRMFSFALSSVYEQNKGRMTAYLFKGRLLQPMLDRMLPPEGSTVAIDTCSDRVKELAGFCSQGDSNDRLVYKGVELVFVNDEAKETLAGIKKGTGKGSSSDDTDALAELIHKTLDKARKG